MSEYFGQVQEADIENFLKDQKEVRGEEFEIPTLEQQMQSITKPAESRFSMYREALGAARSVKLTNGLMVIVGKPKVKTIKYLLSIVETLQEKANGDPVGTIEEFEKIMLQCLKFPANQQIQDEESPVMVDFVTPKTLDERIAWFAELDADDGLLLGEEFTKVFDIKYLLSRASNTAGKK